MKKNYALLMRGLAHWRSMEEFRRERARCKRYLYGRQWEDTIEVDGVRVREIDHIRNHGYEPLKNNLIRRMVRNILGVYRDRWGMPSVGELGIRHLPDAEMRCAVLADRIIAEDMEEMYTRTLEEFLISGMAVHRKHIDPACDIHTDYVQPDYFIIDTEMRDFRGRDATILGEIHDIDFERLCAAFAKDAAMRKRLSSIYHGGETHADVAATLRQFGVGEEGIDFLRPRNVAHCRVIELWHRSAADGRWSYTYLSPDGDVLMEGESPYPRGVHPYIFKAYPYIDGEIHSFVADIIDQQRYVNRLITLYDWIMRASAKGVLLFPDGALPEGVDLDEICDEWSRFNGVILYRPKPGMPMPQQVSSNSTNVGITELLNIQLTMMEDISGVNGAIQGKLDSTGTSGALYDRQTRQALTGLLDILRSYQSFVISAMRWELEIPPAVPPR